MTLSVSTTRLLEPNTPWFTGEEPQPDDFSDSNTCVLINQRGHFPITLPVGQDLILGRHSPDLLRLTPDEALSSGLSRLHAKLIHNTDGWWLEDLNSLNGTWLNKQRLAPLLPYRLELRNRVVLAHLATSIVLPHKVFGGIIIPYHSSGKTPTHVLCMENDLTLREILTSTLVETEPEINLQHFTHGNEALAFIKHCGQTIDLFILDTHLFGDLNGLEIAQKIRHLGCPGHIILTSGTSAPPEELLKALQCEFLPKPLHILDIPSRLVYYRLNKTA